MTTYLIPVIVGVVGLAIGTALTYVIAFSGAKSKAKRILAEAEAQGEVMKKNKLLEVKEKFLNKKAELEKEVAARSQKLQQAESRIKQRELQLNQQQSENQRRRNEVDAIKANLDNQMKIVGEKQAELDKLQAQDVLCILLSGSLLVIALISRKSEGVFHKLYAVLLGSAVNKIDFEGTVCY